MRKALIGFILAATVMTPVAAEAQRGDRAERVRNLENRGQARAERQQQRVERQQARQERAPRQEVPQQRQEVRQQRQEVRQQRQEVRQQRQEVRQQRQPVVVQRQERRQDRTERTRQSDYPNAWQGNPNDPMRRHYEDLERRNQARYGTREQRQDVRREVRQERREDRRDTRRDRREDRRDTRQDRREDRRDWRQDRRERRDWRRDWNREWRNDRRYDWNRWRHGNRNIFRLGRYYSPYRDWNYRRFSIGLILQPLFYSDRYWISDPWQYRLPPAPPGTQWVRYYNDVLLVDTWSGEVVDVIYDFFW